MRLLSFLPAIFCLLNGALAAPTAAKRDQAAETAGAATAGPQDGRDIQRAWIDLASGYNHLNSEWKRVRAGPGAFGRSGVPQAHQQIMDVFLRTERELGPMKPIGVWDAAMLWSPVWQLLDVIQDTMKTIKNSKSIVQSSGETNNVRNMLVQQESAFQHWSQTLLKVLPAVTGQQSTGQLFINRAVQEYNNIIREF